jgi:hypothetical protein
LTPGPAGVAQYLASQHPLDLFVTDAAGHTQWLHEPYLDGDTLRGLRNRELPPERVAVPVTRIQSLAVPEISSGRTLGLVGGLFGAAILTILIIGSVGPQPVY